MTGHPSEASANHDDRFARVGGPSFRGGCGFLAVLFVAGVAARIGYVEIADRRAAAAADRRCTQDHVLQIRQPKVWQDYVSRSYPPSYPPDPAIVQQRRLREQHDLRVASGLEIASVREGDDNVVILSNANGEVARLTFVIASSIAFSFEGPRTQIFDCYGRRRNLYRYSFLFT